MYCGSKVFQNLYQTFHYNELSSSFFLFLSFCNLDSTSGCSSFLNDVSTITTDEPEIEVESEKVHSGVGKEAHLTCIVHGEPRPTVRWFKENTELRPSGIGSSIHPKIFIESKENTHRHTLVLRGLVNKNDFGNYSCVAENSLGTSK